MDAKQPIGALDDLQFDRVEPQGNESEVTLCTACKRPIAGDYYAVGEKIVCADCRQAIAASLQGGSGIARFITALLLGTVAAIVSGLVWYGITRMTGYEIGLIAIVVGLAVGVAVRAGAKGRGGWLYQLMAVVLTYLAVTGGYVPELIASFMQDTELPQAFIVPLACAIALAAPFLSLPGNILGIIIIGIALWEAWKINKRPAIDITGPYTLAPAPGAVGSATRPFSM